MPGPFDWINEGLLGRPDPEQAIADWSNNQQAQNRRAIGLNPDGTPAIVPPGGGQQPPDALPPGQTPNAMKPTQSLGALMMQLQQHNESEQLFNQSLGGAFSAFGQPRDRERMAGMFNVNLPDPTKIAQQQQDLASQQQGQDRVNALGQILTSNDPRMQAQAQQIATSLNIPLADLKAQFLANPANTATMISTFRAPTDPLKNLQQIGDLQNQYLQKSQDSKTPPTELRTLRNQILASVAGTEAAPMVADQLNWLDKNGSLPPWHDNLQAYNQYKVDQKTLNDNQTDAFGRHSTHVPQVLALNNALDRIKSNPALDTLFDSPAKQGMAQRIINSTSEDPISTIISTVSSAIGGTPVTFTPEERQLLSDIRQTKGAQYGEALKSIGLSRPTGAEVASIDKGLSQLGNIGLFSSGDQYREQALNPFSDMVNTSIGNSYGAAGALKDMPTKYRTYVNPDFLAGGRQRPDNQPDDGSEKWGSGMTMDEADQAAANAALARHAINPDTKRPFTRYELEQALRQRGKRPNF
jgi:hypothetical protein